MAEKEIEIKRKNKLERLERKDKLMIDSSDGLVSGAYKILKNDWMYFLKVGLIAIIIYSFLYGIWKIPFFGFGLGRMSRVGFVDYLFLIAVTFFVSTLFTLSKYEREKKLRNDAKVMGVSASGLAGFVSAACPVCQGVTIAALGSTIFTIPLGFLVPYLGFIQVASLGLLGLAVFFKADSVFTRTCEASIGKEIKSKSKSKKNLKEPFLFRSNLVFTLAMILTVLIVFNQFLIPRVYAFTGIGGGGGGAISISAELEYGPKTTLKPMPLSQGEQPRIPGYKSIVKPLPTISELEIMPSTGDLVQDLINNIIPRGTPWYGAEAGVSFDDPITAQNLWGRGESIQLDSKQDERWKRIVNAFTCDYCCGSPQSPTIITRCGCAHAQAARGMAKWFVKNYGDKYSDEEIYGEMARWYALWYQQGTVQRIIQESQVA